MKIPNAESLILFAFLGCIALWAISKCSARRTDFVRQLSLEEQVEEPQASRDTVVPTKPQAIQEEPAPAPPPAPAQEPTQYSTTLRKPKNLPENPEPAASETKAAPAKSGTTLYVTIDGLKLRKEPGLKSEVLEQLSLNSPVTFLNQKTEWTQEINLGKETVTDHWVRIKSAKGKTGWVFGAGVHYYKMKRSGVMN
ncbi:MAG: SH3 domain-containing protein [Saprospiraceae bacterium]